jgi:hypothetical protein
LLAHPNRKKKYAARVGRSALDNLDDEAHED